MPDSLISLPLSFMNVPEPSSVEGSFVYNFYVPKEDVIVHPAPGSPISYAKDVITSQTTVNEIEENSRGAIRARVPRYIKFNIKRSPTINAMKTLGPGESVWVQCSNTDFNTDFAHGYFLSGGPDMLLSQIIKNLGSNVINMEGQVSPNYFSDAVLSDSSANLRNQQMIYRLAGSLLENALLGDNVSDEDIATQLSQMLPEDINASDILTLLTDNSILGVSVSNDASTAAISPLKRKESATFAAKFEAQSYRSVLAKISRTNPFFLGFEQDIMGKNPIANINIHPDVPNSLSPADQKPKLTTIQSTRYNYKGSLDHFNAQDHNNPQVYHAGYIVEKSGISPSGKVTDYPPMISYDPEQTDFCDVQVLYGHTYSYKARNLFLVSEKVVREYYPDVTWSDGSSGSIDLDEHFYLVASRSPKPATIVAKEIQPPNPVSIAFYSFEFSEGKGLRIDWKPPSNEARDIKKYQVFKRMSINEPFEIIAEYDFTDPGYSQFNTTELVSPELIHKMKHPKHSYVDNTFDRSSSGIYTIVAIDAHGLSSTLGTQIFAKFDKYRNSLDTTMISKPGAPKAYPNMRLISKNIEEIGVARITEDAAKDSNHSKMRIYLDPSAYKVQQNLGSGQQSTNTVSGHTKGNYKFQIINLDRQKTKVLNISVKGDDTLNGLL